MCLLQEDDFDEWQDGSGPSNGAGGEAAAAGASRMQAAGQQAAADVGEDEDEEWEEV